MSIMTDWIDTMEDYGFDDLDRTTLARLLDDSHKELCLREPWPFLERQETIVQAANDDTLSTTASLGKVLALVNTTDNFVLQPLRTDSQLKDYVASLSDAGMPTHYYFVGDTLYLWPVPSVQTTFKIRFITEPTTLVEASVDSAVLWPSKHDSVVLYGALSKAYFINDDPQGAAMQQVMEGRYQVARADLWMKQYDRPDVAIVYEDDDFLI